jgi:hypothetical protein
MSLDIKLNGRGMCFRDMGKANTFAFSPDCKNIAVGLSEDSSYVFNMDTKNKVWLS